MIPLNLHCINISKQIENVICQSNVLDIPLKSPSNPIKSPPFNHHLPYDHMFPGKLTINSKEHIASLATHPAVSQIWHQATWGFAALGDRALLGEEHRGVAVARPAALRPGTLRDLRSVNFSSVPAVGGVSQWLVSWNILQGGAPVR